MVMMIINIFNIFMLEMQITLKGWKHWGAVRKSRVWNLPRWDLKKKWIVPLGKRGKPDCGTEEWPGYTGLMWMDMDTSQGWRGCLHQDDKNYHQCRGESWDRQNVVRDPVWRSVWWGGKLLGFDWLGSETRIFHHIYSYYYPFPCVQVGMRGTFASNDIVIGQWSRWHIRVEKPRYGQDPEKLSVSGRKSLNKC